MSLGKATAGRAPILHIAMRRARCGTSSSGTPGTALPAAVRVCRSTFPVVRRALFSDRCGYWRNDVPPIHPAMTFKYFRTRCAVPSLLHARDAREKLADVRWMRNRHLSLLSVFPKLASHDEKRMLRSLSASGQRYVTLNIVVPLEKL